MRDKKDWQNIIDTAEAAFWEVVAKAAPEAATGDLSPDDQMAFEKACRDAVAAWMKNLPKKTTGSAECRFVVELRPPKKGERGIWIRDDRSPHAALRKVLGTLAKEWDWWIAGEDLPEEDEFDENGLRAVTLSFNADVMHVQGTLSPADLMRVQGFDPYPRTESEARDYLDRLAKDLAAMPSYRGWVFEETPHGALSYGHLNAGVSIFCTPDWSRPGSVDIEVQREDGRPLPMTNEDRYSFKLGEDTAEYLFKVVKPYLDRYMPKCACPACGSAKVIVETMEVTKSAITLTDENRHVIAKRIPDKTKRTYMAICQDCGEDGSLDEFGIIGTPDSWDWHPAS